MKHKGKHFEESRLKGKHFEEKRLKGKHFATNTIIKTGFKLSYTPVYCFLTLIVMLSMMVPLNINNLLAYFTYKDVRANEFSINAEYIVYFNANTGTGTMSPQTISYNVPTRLTTNAYTKTGYAFNEWNTDPRRCRNIIY